MATTIVYNGRSNNTLTADGRAARPTDHPGGANPRSACVSVVARSYSENPTIGGDEAGVAPYGMPSRAFSVGKCPSPASVGWIF